MQTVDAFLKYIKDKPMVDELRGISTGSTLLNLAITNNADIGFLCGKYHFLVGDSTSGKTALSLTCLAEAANNSEFDSYRLIYDDVEGGNLFDIKKLFGTKLYNRIESPCMDNDEPVYSYTIESFYYNVANVLEEGRPFIYILDSMDSLSSTSEIDKFDEQKMAFYQDKNVAGSYGDGKAKINSSSIRRLLAPLIQSGSILIIISQTRDNIGNSFGGKTRAGGHALRFYATVEIWSSIASKLKRMIKKRERTVGVSAKIQIRKNRVTGREREICLPIYYHYGIDDVGSCINYLLEEGYWSKSKQSINAHDFSMCVTLPKLLEWFDESEDRVIELRRLVAVAWHEIEESIASKRKARYE